MFGYTIKATDRDLARLTAERRKEFYHPHTIRVWERSGRNFHGRNAVAYLLPERALPYFKAPAEAYLRGIQTNLDTYWGVVGETSGIRVRDGKRKQVSVWQQEFGRAKYPKGMALKAFFVVAGAQLRWRMTSDPDRAVQKVEAVGIRTVEQLRYAASRDLNARLKRAGFPMFKVDTLKVIAEVEITSDAQDAAAVLLEEEVERKFGGGKVRQQRSMERLSGLRKSKTDRHREQEEQQRLAAERAAALHQGTNTHPRLCPATLSAGFKSDAVPGLLRSRGGESAGLHARQPQTLKEPKSR